MVKRMVEPDPMPFLVGWLRWVHTHDNYVHSQGLQRKKRLPTTAIIKKLD
jgi:hypothetical protein